MTQRGPFRAKVLRGSAALVCAGWLGCGAAVAQQLIGYVNTRDAEVTGASDELNGQAVLTGSAAVTARDHMAPITLGRGGTVRVCQTSAIHITESKSADLAAPLLFALDRGAVEIQMAGRLNDGIMTPDLRFTVVTAGPLDLRLRVARNGDTCVENRGPAAPTLDISDPFGEMMYQVSAGQHVLFEHGSLHEVVDHEQTPCGCPEPQKGMSLADALLASGGAPAAAKAPAAPAQVATVAAPVVAPAAARPTAAADPQAELQAAEQTAAQAAMQAAEQKHPFPAAVSEGLAPAPEVPQAAAGAVHMQISDSLSYNAPATPGATAPATEKGQAKPGAATPQQKPPSRNVFRAVGHFFKKLFAD